MDVDDTCDISLTTPEWSGGTEAVYQRRYTLCGCDDTLIMYGIQHQVDADRIGRDTFIELWVADHIEDQVHELCHWAAHPHDPSDSGDGHTHRWGNVLVPIIQDHRESVTGVELQIQYTIGCVLTKEVTTVRPVEEQNVSVTVADDDGRRQ